MKAGQYFEVYYKEDVYLAFDIFGKSKFLNPLARELEDFEEWKKEGERVLLYCNKDGRLVFISGKYSYVGTGEEIPTQLIPDNWCVEGVNEVAKLCITDRNLFEEIKGKYRFLPRELGFLKRYYYYPRDKAETLCTTHKIPNNKKLITFNQFRKYILQVETKEEVMEERKIVGYKLDKLEYKDAAKNIAVGCGCSFELMFTPEVSAVKLWEKAGVLDLWFKPVYEEEVLPKIGCKEGTVNKFGINYGKTYVPTGVLKGMKNANILECTLEYEGEKIHVTRHQLERIYKVLNID